MTTRAAINTSSFIWRRVHSLMGLWLILYLIEHLIINSQATLWIGDEGIGFVRLVDLLESLPYLQVVEILLIGVPFAVHIYWGVRRLLTAKSNSFHSDGSKPSLQIPRNYAFTWQRITSWILLIGVIGHVVQMRFVQSPQKIRTDHGVQYRVDVSKDQGIYSVAKRVGVDLTEIDQTTVNVSSADMGKVMLFMVRDTFKSPLMSALYSIFVLAASFHAFNGFWTSLITWGALLSYRSQKAVLPICWLGVGLLSFLGLAAIWGSYWLNLRS